jgi:hypothetical protein
MPDEAGRNVREVAGSTMLVARNEFFGQGIGTDLLSITAAGFQAFGWMT